MNTPNTLLLLLAFLLLGIQLKGADRPEITFRKLKTSPSLSSGNVQAIFQDPDGYLWFGTNNGLNRFDGTSLKVYFRDEGDSTTISGSSIYDIFQGPEGNLWIKDYDRIFNVYLRDREVFEADMSGLKEKYALRSAEISKVFEDSRGDFWFLHPYEGITYYNSQRRKSTYLFHKPTAEGSLSHNAVSDIQEDPDGNFWVIYSHGWVDILSGERLKVINSFRILAEAEAQQAYNFKLVIDQSGDAWAFSPDFALGVFAISGADLSVKNIHDRSSPLKLNNSLVKSILVYSEDEIWLGTDHGGINIIDKRKNEIRYVIHQPDQVQTLSHNAIYALFKDKDGIVWVGTHKRGIDMYHPHFSRFGLVKRTMATANPAAKNDVNAFEEWTAGRIVVGSNGGGLWIYDQETGNCRDFLKESRYTGDLPPADLVVVDLYKDSSGILWIGTYQNGLYSVDGTVFTQYLASQENPESLKDNNVWKIFEDSRKRLWIGTLREGLFLLDRKKGTFTQYTSEGEGILLNNEYITAINEDSAGNIWVGGSLGIDVFHPERGYQHYFPGNEHDSSGLSSNTISEIVEDPYGMIWVSTENGLFYYESASGMFRGFDQSNGLDNHFLVSLVSDDSGNLWLGSQDGLTYAEVDRSQEDLDLKFRFFTGGDGLQGNYFNKNSAFLSSTGLVYFGGSDGINYLHPECFPFNDTEPEVVFTSFSLFNHPIAVNQEVNGRIIIPTVLDRSRSIQLKHHENIFSVSFSSLNYLSPEKSSFLYRLDGFSREWVEISKPPFEVSFTNLDPGKYTLMVKAANPDGVSGKETATLEIEILYPFWQTPLAYLAYGLILIVCFILAWRWFVYQERQRLRRQEEIKENRRLAELDQMKSRFFANVSHEFKTPLTLILAPIEKMVKDKSAVAETFQFRTIQKNAQKLLFMVNQLLEIRNVENERLQLERKEGDMVAFTEEKVRTFRSLSIHKQIGLTFSSNVRNLPTNFDPDKMETVLYNLLSNAFKFTIQGGEVNVSLEFQQHGLSQGLLLIKIRDSGIGIPEEIQDKIFDRYFTLGMEGNQGTGIGLSLVQEFARLHGGDVTLESKQGHGTLFVLSLPITLREGYLVWEEFFLDTGRDELISAPNDQEHTALPHLLLVEDNHELRHYLAEILNENYKVEQAEHGKEALEKAHRNIPDIILSDILMPVMDGIAMCRAIRSDIKTSHVPVVLLTAKTAEEDHLQGLESGCNLYLEKPFNLEILLSSLKNLLEERSRLQKHYRKVISVHTSEAEIESLDDKLIQEAVALVEKEIENPEFSVEILSRKLGMSRVHLYKKINSLTGQSPLEFIRSIRLQRAAQLLEMNQYTISEVAYMVGYNNAKYFSKHFKANYGKLPSQFQKTNRKA
ncbi:Signal transduction histidine kinase [Cyclobacterium lianum]|uniref:histidine kinase n=1 Tax=Cyclobacterium lianum TaxID=388280 RepID=A0A1M7NW63_9BACT|nr:two-component regulator propeller domain-containing protein [Cyclobacterium lianum]SHN08437.1 Signal transduction histidine kinase [Cyclobacterium lianum]